MQNKSKGLLFYSIIVVYPLLSFVTVNADDIKLKSGDVIRGKISQKNESIIILDHNDLGQIEIPKDKVLSITTESPKPKKPDEPTKIIEPNVMEDETGAGEKEKVKEQKLNIFESFASKAKKKGYSLAATFSLDLSTGNTDEQSLRFGLDVGRKLPDLNFSMDFTYYNKIKEGSTTDNKFTVGVSRKKFFKESKWFYFMTSRYDYDEFESWLHRLSGHLGPGYRLIKKDKLLLDIKVGAGVRKEWKSENDNLRFEGYSGLDLEWKPTKRQEYAFSVILYPVLSDFHDYRTRTTFDWSFLMSTEVDLSLIIGVLHEYQSVVDPGDEHDDLRIYSGIRYKF